jgi:predicted nucleotidyltransferase
MVMPSLIDNNRPKIRELCRLYGVARLEIFGSAAKGGFDPAHSDIDFLVIFKPATPGEHARRYFGLLAALQDLFQKEIDLIEIRAVRNPYLKQSIEKSSLTLYET